MTLEDVLALTRRRIGAILCGLLAGIVLSTISLWLTPVTYTASAIAYVRVSVPASGPDQKSADSYYAASQLASQKVKAFVPVFTSESVAQGVIDALGLRTTPAQLARSISAKNEKNALTINVSASAPTAEEAQTIADETIRQADAQIKRLDGADSPIGVALMSSAGLSGATRSPSPAKRVGTGALSGIVVGYVSAFALDVLDRRIRSQSDVASVVDEPVLATIPRSVEMTRRRYSEAPDHRVEEALRKLRTNLRYTNIDKGLHTLVVTSAMQADGKSTVSANLARVMALSGLEVILVEGDLRKPTMSSTFDIDPSHPGLSHLLVGAASLESALVRPSVPGLQVIPAGDTPPNPSELLGSARMSELLTYLAADHVVIVDAPPVLPVTDAVALAENTDGVLLVVRSGRTTEDQLQQAVSSIRQGGGTVLGIALNQVSSSALGRLRYGETVYGYATEYRARPAGPPAPAAAPDAALEDIAESPPRHANRAPGLGGIERLRDAGHAEGAASTAEFIAMLARRRPAASRWSSSEARTWRSRAGALSATSPAITTKA
ncbi:MAG: exopolysaccharide biosynthesis protein [Actinomyces sp.]|nr:MAG: exopolysaccharide biosynthesis protein [Actinomyces sp.]